MMKGSRQEGEEQKYIFHHGEMTDEELFEAVKKKREKRKGLTR